MRIEDSSNSVIKRSSTINEASVSVNEQSMKKLSRILSRNIYDMSASFVREAWLNARESVDKLSYEMGTNSDEWRGQDATKRTEIILPTYSKDNNNGVRFTPREDIENAFNNENIKSSYNFNRSATKSFVIPEYGKLKMGSTFSLRDYGMGLSHDEFESLILSFGSSSKDQDNTYGGGMGIGSLSAFSMTDVIEYDCFKDGVRNSYRIMEYGEVVIRYIEDEPTDQSNGVRITCDIDFDSHSEYTNFIKDCMNFFVFSKENEALAIVHNESDMFHEYRNTVQFDIDEYVLYSGYEYDYSNKDNQVGRLIDGSHAEPFLTYNNSNLPGSLHFQNNNIAVLIDGCFYKGVSDKGDTPIPDLIQEKVYDYIDSKVVTFGKVQSFIGDRLRYKDIAVRYPLCVPVGYFSVKDDMNPSRETVQLSQNDIDLWIQGVIEQMKPFLDVIVQYLNIEYGKPIAAEYRDDVMKQAKIIIDSLSRAYDMDCDPDEFFRINHELTDSILSSSQSQVGHSIEDVVDYCQSTSRNLGLISENGHTVFFDDPHMKYYWKNSQNRMDVNFLGDRVVVGIPFFHTKTALSEPYDVFSSELDRVTRINNNDNIGEVLDENIIGFDRSGEYAVSTLPGNTGICVIIHKPGSKVKVNNEVVITSPFNSRKAVSKKLDSINESIKNGSINLEKLRKIVDDPRSHRKVNMLAQKIVQHVDNHGDNTAFPMLYVPGIYGKLAEQSSDSITMDLNRSNLYNEVMRDHLNLTFFAPEKSVYVKNSDITQVFKAVSSTKVKKATDKGNKYNYSLWSQGEEDREYKEYIGKVLGDNNDGDSEHSDDALFVIDPGFSFHYFDIEESSFYDDDTNNLIRLMKDHVTHKASESLIPNLIHTIMGKDCVFVTLPATNMKTNRAVKSLEDHGYSDITVINNIGDVVDYIHSLDDDARNRALDLCYEAIDHVVHLTKLKQVENLLNQDARFRAYLKNNDIAIDYNRTLGNVLHESGLTSHSDSMNALLEYVDAPNEYDSYDDMTTEYSYGLLRNSIQKYPVLDLMVGIITLSDDSTLSSKIIDHYRSISNYSVGDKILSDNKIKAYAQYVDAVNDSDFLTDDEVKESIRKIINYIR